jgi:hypothetical protein
MIEAQFLSNSESHVLQFDVRFCIFKQGDLSLSNYCHRMKGMADDLRALGETVTDRHLVLNLLQGLKKRFDLMKIFIKRSQSFPSFDTIRNDLEPEEIELDHSTAQGHASVFYSAPSTIAAASAPTTTGTAMLSGAPSPSCPQPQHRWQRQGQGERER